MARWSRSMFRKNILSKDGVGEGFGPGVVVAGDWAKQVVEMLALTQKNIAQIHEGRDFRKQTLMGFLQIRGSSDFELSGFLAIIQGDDLERKPPSALSRNSFVEKCGSIFFLRHLFLRGRVS